MIKLLVSALEPSANLHLEPVLEKLQKYELKGIFDEKLGTPLYPSSDFGVMGFVDVVPKIAKAREAIKEMVFLSKNVDKVLLIDSPAFNLPLAKAIKKENQTIEIIYYILPQVWAWKKGRVKKVEKYCDKLASILPFEPSFYNKATYVGNPLLDEIETFKTKDTTYDQISFLPGSRKSEIKSLMPVFRKIAKKIDKKKVLVVPKFFKNRDIESIYGDTDDFKISYNMQESLSKSDFAFICSGTATLEAALIGVPFVLAYKAKKLDYFIAKRFIKLKYVGLANIIMEFEKEEALHEELLQKDVNPSRLLKAYEEFDYEHFYQRSKKLKQILKHGSAENVVKMITV